jgi:hypothetical protein
VFDIELPLAKKAPQSKKDSFNEVAKSFGGRRVLQGSESAIRDLMYKNLVRLSKLPGFKGFRVDWFDDIVVFVSAFLSDHIMTPLQKRVDEYCPNWDLLKERKV